MRILNDKNLLILAFIISISIIIFKLTQPIVINIAIIYTWLLIIKDWRKNKQVKKNGKFIRGIKI